MPRLPKRITAPVGRLGAAAQNAREGARFGGLDAGEEPSPYAVAAEHRIYRLRHYHPPARPDVVHVVDEIPVTTWYRPLTGPLRDGGLPPADAQRAW